jgi:peptidoglycan-associated lipoprotein
MLLKYIVPCMALIAAPALADEPSAPSEGAAPLESAAPPMTKPTSGCGLVRVHFDTDSAELGADEKEHLDTAAACLKSKERLRVTVSGNTDERGTIAYNQALGLRRAQAVSNYLQSKGVRSDQLLTESMGKQQPLCDENNAECWQKNRRTTLRDACRL